jgi:hypothetical protein
VIVSPPSTPPNPTSSPFPSSPPVSGSI